MSSTRGWKKTLSLPQWKKLLIILVILSDCHAFKPQLYPNLAELQINEGDTLKITCMSKGYINFHFPTSNARGRTTSQFDIIPEGRSTNKTFIRSSTVFGDTGWYCCADESKQITNMTFKNHNEQGVTWMYVYVKSNNNPFVHVNKKGNYLLASGCNNYIIFPCQTTSPEFTVTLKEMEKVFKLGEKITYDPKIGYIVNNAKINYYSVFTCSVNQNKSSQMIEIKIDYLSIFFCMSKPNIKVNGLKDMTVGSKLSLKCTVKVRREAIYNIFWKIPNNMTSRIIFNNVQEVAEKYYTYDLITSELIVDNVTFGDKGNYECQVKSSFNKTKSTHTYICIYDSNKPYIHLTSNNKNVYGKYGDSVTFVAYATACPTPNFKWVDNHGFRIHSDPSLGYSILTKYNESTLSMSLRIDNIKPFNRGFYTLSAGNIAGKKELTFRLEILDKPRVWLNTSYPKGYYSFNESVTFACHVESKSKFNISWTYKRHLKFKFQYIDETNKILRLHGMNTNETSNNAESESIVMISPLGRSTIKCTACNKDGCVNKEHDIYVTDGVPNKAFGVIEPKTKFYESQNISLVCAAVIHIFSEVQWYDNKNEKIVDSERIHVKFKETNYTERAILSITNVSHSDERDYYCVTKNLYGKIREKYSLKINIPAYFVHVNMNDFAIIRFAKDPENPVYLLCYIGGTPTPNITWFKDGTPLESSKQFSLEDRNQKLIIRYLLESDSGNYSCVAENGLWPVTKSQKIIVKENQKLYVWIGLVVWFITLLASLSVYFYLKVQYGKFKEKQLPEAGLTHFEEGALDLINPDLTVEDQAELLPYDKRWEFSREKLRIDKQLGSGAFGVVYKAEAYRILPNESVTTVAVKTIRKNADLMYISALAKELKIMIYLGQHLNIINLLGACTKNIAKRELLVIVELCRFGNLQNYLIYHRKNFIDQIDPNTGRINPAIKKKIRRTSHDASVISDYSDMTSQNSKPENEPIIYDSDAHSLYSESNDNLNNDDMQPGWRSNYKGDYVERDFKSLCSQDLLVWAYQVAKGMEYLSQRKVLHCDLTARNILLAENNIIKICDFGLAKTLYKDENYKKQHDGKFPFRWMAIESIRDGVFSTMSDVWSFGVVLWEFFTLAKIPYSGVGFEVMYQKLVKGYRLRQPIYSTQDIYDIILWCWEDEPTLRPSFTELVESIGKLLEDDLKVSLRRLYHQYKSLNVTSHLEGKKELAYILLPNYEITPSIQHNYANTSLQLPISSYM